MDDERASLLAPQNPSLLPSYSTAQVTTMAFPAVARQKLIRARILAVAAFLFHLACALFAVLAKDGWRTVSKQNRYAFTPYTWMALAFWAAQTVLQLYWVRNLFIYDETDVARLEALPYAPLYAAASVCFGIYIFLFIYHYFLVALIFILAATSIQLWAVGQLPINTHDNLATQLNAKSAAAFAVLLCAQAFGVAFKLTPPPNTLAKALFGVFVGFAALTTDPLFGFGLVYDLVALTIGQHRLWASELTWITIAVGVVVAVKFMVFRVY